MNKLAFIDWVRRRLAPKLRHGDIVLLDNLPAHKAPEVRFYIEQRGAIVKPLPPTPTTSIGSSPRAVS